MKWHLNGLALDGEQLIASCFGPKNDEGTWDTGGPRVFYVVSGETICGNLDQPHTPLVAEHRLFFAESKARKTHIYTRNRSSGWDFDKTIVMSGYVRGLTMRSENRLWAGISAERKLSRSRQQLVGSQQQTRLDSALVEIDPVSGAITDTKSLLAYGREPYDLLAVTTRPAAMEPMSLVMSARMRETEERASESAALISALYRENIGLKDNLDFLRSEKRSSKRLCLGELLHPCGNCGTFCVD